MNQAKVTLLRKWMSMLAHGRFTGSGWTIRVTAIGTDPAPTSTAQQNFAQLSEDEIWYGEEAGACEIALSNGDDDSARVLTQFSLSMTTTPRLDARPSIGWGHSVEGVSVPEPRKSSTALCKQVSEVERGPIDFPAVETSANGPKRLLFEGGMEAIHCDAQPRRQSKRNAAKMFEGVGCIISGQNIFLRIGKWDQADLIFTREI